MLGKKGVAYAPSVLVTGNTAKGIFLAVKNKSSVGIDLKASATESCRNLVANLAVLYKLCLKCVKIGVASSVPKVYVFDFKGRVCVLRLTRCNRIIFLIIYCIYDLLSFFRIFYINLNLNLCIFSKDRRSYRDSRTSVILKIKMAFVYANNINVSVKSAVKGEIGSLRINLV